MVNHSAIFFDRDGVINKPVYHELTNEYGAPWSIKEIELFNGIEEVMRELSFHHYIFVVSNQPDAAKGNINYITLMTVLKWFEEKLFMVNEFYWCLHHPTRCQCLCRKPNTLSVERAIIKYGIDASRSYFIGDRDIDIECGKRVGLNTIFVPSNYDPQELLVNLI